MFNSSVEKHLKWSLVIYPHELNLLTICIKNNAIPVAYLIENTED